MKILVLCSLMIVRFVSFAVFLPEKKVSSAFFSTRVSSTKYARTKSHLLRYMYDSRAESYFTQPCSSRTFWQHSSACSIIIWSVHRFFFGAEISWSIWTQKHGLQRKVTCAEEDPGPVTLGRCACVAVRKTPMFQSSAFPRVSCLFSVCGCKFQAYTIIRFSLAPRLPKGECATTESTNELVIGGMSRMRYCIPTTVKLLHLRTWKKNQEQPEYAITVWILDPQTVHWKKKTHAEPKHHAKGSRKSQNVRRAIHTNFSRFAHGLNNKHWYLKGELAVYGQPVDASFAAAKLSLILACSIEVMLYLANSHTWNWWIY